MDVSLFARIVKELILEKDRVGLPGMGYFVADIVPSTFSDRGFVINPPYRRLSFFAGECNDYSLSLFYAAQNGLDIEKAEVIIGNFLGSMKDDLQSKRFVSLPGLGKFRITSEGVIFFVADPDLDIYPDAIGLESVSLRTRDWTEPETPAVAAVPQTGMQDHEAIPTEPQEQPAQPEQPESQEQQEQPAQPVVQEQTEQPELQERPSEHESSAGESRLKWWMIPLALIGATAIFLCIFIVLSYLAPDFIDSILYSEEELRIINY